MRRFVQAFSSGSGFPPAIADPIANALAALPDRYNISVGQSAGVLFLQDEGWKVADMAWGLIPSWEPQPSTRYSTQTARLDRAPGSRLFRRAWATRRCAIPLNGYYKWDRHALPRQPYFIQSTTGEHLFVAGLWSRWGDAVLSFSILTHANPAIPAPLVPDGPVFLQPAAIMEWMQSSPEAAARLLARMPQPQLEAYAVSRRVANRKLDDYSLLEPLSALGEPDLEVDPEDIDEDDR